MVQERLSHADGLALARAWQKSGQRQSAFCQAHGVSVHVLQYWRGQLKESSESAEISLMPISAPVKHTGTDSAVSFVRAADGTLRVCVDGDFDAAVCRAALELLP